MKTSSENHFAGIIPARYASTRFPGRTLAMIGNKSMIQRVWEQARLPRSPLEITESLEQNRWLENGFKIRTAITKWESMGIDTLDDLENAKAWLDNF